MSSPRPMPGELFCDFHVSSQWVSCELKFFTGFNLYWFFHCKKLRCPWIILLVFYYTLHFLYSPRVMHEVRTHPMTVRNVHNLSYLMVSPKSPLHVMAHRSRPIGYPWGANLLNTMCDHPDLLSRVAILICQCDLSSKSIQITTLFWMIATRIKN